MRVTARGDLRHNPTMADTVGIRIAEGRATIAGWPSPTATPMSLSGDGTGVDILLDRWPTSPTSVVFDVDPIVAGWVGAAPQLGRVTVVRIAPSAASISAPFDGWPAHLRASVDGGWVHVTGGIDLHGWRHPDADTTTLDRAIDTAIASARRGRCAAICVSGMGALLDPDVEHAIAERLVRRCPQQQVVVAHEAGGRRFIERERAAILNAALGPAMSALADALESAVGPAARVGYAGADGARCSAQEARAQPIRLLGTGNALVAQGAAAQVRTSNAVVLVWSPETVRLLAVEDGVLRTRRLRRARLLARMGISQRHATQSRVMHPATQALAPDLVGGRPVVLARALDDVAEVSDLGEVEARFARFADELQRRLPEARVLPDDPETLAALGAAAALPQSEVLRYAVADSPEQVAASRRVVRHLAQGQVLAAAEGAVDLHTYANHYTPLSFLDFGPMLLRAHVVGVPRVAGVPRQEHR